MQRGPEFRGASRSKIKILRKHTDDCVIRVAQSDGPSQDVGTSAETLQPSGVAEQYSMWRSWRILLRGKISSKNWSNSERSKEATTYTRARRSLCAFRTT
jgi:hypothetical protein